MASFTLLTCVILYSVQIICATKISYISPHAGSLNGATKLTIWGSGFAVNQFNFGNDVNLGNRVKLISSTRAFDCEVLRDESTKSKVVCYTMPMPDDSYYVRLTVDGVTVPDSDHCNCNGYCYNCYFRPYWGVTPKIKYIEPKTALPGSVITITGFIYTALYGTNIEMDEYGRTHRIKRVYIGGSKCELRDPDAPDEPEINDELYGLELGNNGQSDYGYLKCKIEGSFIGNTNISIIVDQQYGRSIAFFNLYDVKSQGKIAMFQTYAAVDNVSPVTGSLSGGTKLTISGRFFDDTSVPAEVLVGGLPCETVSLSANEIVCTTPPSPNLNTTLYPGNRGVMVEVFKGAYYSADMSHVGDYDPSVALKSFFRDEFYFTGGLGNYANARMRAFFVPTKSCMYTFKAKADDRFELYFSQTSRAEDKELIAYAYSYTNGLYDYLVNQTSRTMFLQKDHMYYMEGVMVEYGGAEHFSVAVIMHETDYTEVQSDMALNEQQKLITNSTYLEEIQLLTFNGWPAPQAATNEVQEVTFLSDFPNDFIYRLGLYGVYSGPILGSLGNSPVADIVNKVLTLQPDTVRVIKSSVAGGFKLTITFNSKRGDWPDFDVIIDETSPANATYTVTEVTTGVATMTSYVLSFDGVPVEEVPISASASDLQAALNASFTVKCPGYVTTPAASTYVQDYEKVTQYKEYGTRVKTIEPFCGVVSSLNPQYIFSEGDRSPFINVFFHKYICFAYRGDFERSITLQYYYYNAGDATRYSRSKKFWGVPFPAKDEWGYKCVDMKTKIEGTDSSATSAYLRTVSLTSKSSVFHIDTVIITAVPVVSDDGANGLVKHERLRPGTWGVKSAVVEGSFSDGFNISLKARSCAYDFPLFAVEASESSTKSGETATFSWSSGASVQVVRDQSATMPPAGTFDIGFGAYFLKDIKADLPASDLQLILETMTDMGSLSVSRAGTCYGYSYTIKWLSRAGDQPLLEILDSSRLTGTGANIRTEKLVDGGVFFDPIPGDMLRMAHFTPQVAVRINNIISICAGNCSFDWSQESTPSITNVQPTSGSSRAGTILTIDGSGFDYLAMENNIVIIGGTYCNVSTATASQIQCSIGQGPAGMHEVILEILDKGLVDTGNQTFYFTYDFEVTSFTPTSGSIGGGQVLTIEGTGFGPNITAYVGSSVCETQFANYSVVLCITPPGSGQNESVSVSDGMTAVNASMTYNYSSEATPTIEAISSNTGSPMGGEIITINGALFGVAQGDSTVRVGDISAEVVFYNDSQITVRLPPLPPGLYGPSVLVEGLGYAINTTGVDISSTLEVNNIYPTRGSQAGGTHITISGQGFPENYAEEIEVLIGERSCSVESVNETEIVCKTPDTSVTHLITNGGIHPVYGINYAWLPATKNIEVNDIVTWKWSGTEGVDNIGYAVHQVSSPTSGTNMVSGFSSGSKSLSGSFSVKFSKAGTYYYWSGPVDNKDKIYMRGTIIVHERTLTRPTITVTLNGIEASYIINEIAPANDFSCGATYSNITGCTEVLPSGENPDNYYFSNSRCSTPVIKSVEPKIATTADEFIITGMGFSDVPCQNMVHFGEFACNVTSSNSTTLTCMIDNQELYPPGVALDIRGHVTNLGCAVVESDTLSERYVYLVPHIKSVAPTIGSIKGGTSLTISGSGFLDSDLDISVNINGVPCKITTVVSNEVVCETGTGYAMSNQSVSLSVHSGGQWLPAECRGDCVFSYASSQTPVISDATPLLITEVNQTVIINGSGFSNIEEENKIYIGSSMCTVLNATTTSLTCNAGAPIAGTQPLQVIVDGVGRADGSFSLIISPSNFTLYPMAGSVFGGQIVTIAGFGFADDAFVEIDGLECDLISLSMNEVLCSTPKGELGSALVEVRSNGYSFPPNAFEYSQDATPFLMSVTPSSGYSGDNVTIEGINFGNDISSTIVLIGGVECNVMSVSQTSVNCTTGSLPAGTYEVTLAALTLGNANNSLNFTYEMGLASVSPASGSFAGGQNLTVNGHGFTEGHTYVTVCDVSCTVTMTTPDTISCLTSNYTQGGSSTEVCDVVVTSGMAVDTLSSAYTYDASLAAEVTAVSPARGGTGGGTNITITGSGFGSDPSAVTVSFAGTPCPVFTVSDTTITCITEAHSPSTKTQAVVEVAGNGIAFQTSADFEYVDVWSSRFTWGGADPPVEGDMVVIPSTMTVLLDTSTPVLALLLIDGGRLIFDETDVELHAEKILVANGGLFQVGTEDEPFMHNALIMLHGHVRSQELPIYGTKMIAVREGTLDLHGIPHNVVWTLLGQTANAGDTSITLMEAVDWEVGDQIVIATTGHRHTQGETEMRYITGKSGGGTVLNLDSALQYEHLGESLSISGGYTLEARAEVGLLTRNVVVRGSNHAQWNDVIQACPDGFDTGEFATQTCFQGRFGEEMGTDEFGSQIILSAPQPHRGLVTGRISNIEVTHAGQAYRLGRYAIHFHLNGDMEGSYVRDCAIHKSFNRAVNIHATNYLLIQNNVLYNIMGGAFFLEDGIEIGNVFEYNVALFVKQSTSLQNDDITPAAFWVTNANNTYRHNRAAGGTHFGWWYRMHASPDGPSYNPNYCPQRIPMGNFYNNTVHSQGWFGIWIFQEFYPMENGRCSGDQPLAARFYALTAWNNEKGAEWVSCGAVQFIDFFLVNNEKAGIEMKLISNAIAYSDERGAALKGGVIAAYPDANNVLPTHQNTKVAIVLPYSRGLGIHNMTFINFDGTRDNVVMGVTDITGTSSMNNGGFTYQMSGTTWINSPRKIGWRWHSEGVIKDLDGTTCGSPGCLVVPDTPTLPTSSCVSSPSEFSVNSDVPGAVCDSSVTLHRWAWNHPAPTSLDFRNVTFTNSYGTTISIYAKKRVTHKPGWHTLLVSGETYIMQFNDSQHLTNISFTGTFYDLHEDEYVILQHNFTQRIDRARVIPGSPYKNASSEPLGPDSHHGDWYIEDDRNMVSYIVSGKSAMKRRNTEPVVGTVDREINLNIERCFYKNCYLPNFSGSGEVTSDKRPEDAVFWEDKETWADAEIGWGGNYGNDYGPPRENDDVIVPKGKWVVLRTPIPKLKELYIYGVLELEYLPDPAGYFYNLTLSCTHIVITGRFIVGWQDNPFMGEAVIELRGQHTTPDIVLSTGASIGSKVLASFGGLELHGKPHNVTWTKLASTVNAGSRVLTLLDEPDWQVGDEVVITPSGFTPWEVEVRTITKISENMITLNASLQYKHTVNSQAVFSDSIYLGCEVGLLSRNVKIVGADYKDLFKESFGARILVGTYADTDGLYTGYAQISDIECYHCGQEGWTDFYDPRFALAFLNIADGVAPSYVVKSSFFHSFSPGIGLSSSNNIHVEDNVIYHTVGSGVIDWSVNNVFRRNLVSLVVFTGTYNNRVEQKLVISAGFEIQMARLTVLEDNVVAGSERAGYRTIGEPCLGKTNPTEYWSGNVAHSALAGVLVLPEDTGRSDGCALWSNFTVSRCFDYGLYYQLPTSLEVFKVVSVDNQVALYDMVIGPDSSGHSFANKYISVRDSTFVGTSDGFDCAEHTMPDHPKDKTLLSFSGPARSWSSPGGGRVGQAFPTFSSGSNMAPFKPWSNIMAYNALYGIKHITETRFINFASACGKEDYAITTMPQNEDLIHPMRTRGLTLINVKSANKVAIKRPTLSKINPSDCVDMDCDGYKKCLLTDSDGSLLGQPGTILPESEWQWDGDRRRGLGDYRVPRTLTTEPDTGDRIPVEDIAPHKGIIRDETCSYNNDIPGWVCSKYDYQLALVESMDADTELRRVSPVAILGEGYLDLINGPQDHGWCFGYTCQRRLSTFPVVVATGKTYELHFTGTTPQSLRLHLLNSLPAQAYVLKIFYAVSQRLDVFYAGKYVPPKNSATDGTGQQILVQPTYEGEYHPNASVSSEVAGANFFDPNTDLLYVLVRGGAYVNIKTSPLIVITFGVPAMSVDEFFGKNLVNNLATFLGIPAEKIKIANAVRESRRRLLSDVIELIIEISNPPSNETDDSNTPAAPDPNALGSSQFANITSTLVNAVQLGVLGDVLNTTLSNIAITEPVPEPSDPSWSTITASLDSGTSYTLSVQVPKSIELVQSPARGKEFSPFTNFPAVHMLDTGGSHVSQLGTKVTPWKFTATLTVVSGNSEAFLTGKPTVASLKGWANFTELGVSHAGQYNIEIRLSGPADAVGRFDPVQFSVTVDPKTLAAKFISSPREVEENDIFSMEIEIVDAETGDSFSEIYWKGHEWYANVSLHMPEMYPSMLVGDVNTKAFNNETSTAMFNVSLASRSRYFILGQVWSMPNDYFMTVISDSIDILTSDDMVRVHEVSKNVTIRFDYDYATYVSGKEEYFIAMAMNQLSAIYKNVSFLSYTVSAGSILLSFTISGSDADVNSAINTMTTQMQSGFTVVFNGASLSADKTLYVNGYSVTAAPGLEILGEGLLWWHILLIALAVAVVIGLLVALIIVFIFKKNKKQMQTHAESSVESLDRHGPVAMSDDVDDQENKDLWYAPENNAESSETEHGKSSPSVVQPTATKNNHKEVRPPTGAWSPQRSISPKSTKSQPPVGKFSKVQPITAQDLQDQLNS